MKPLLALALAATATLAGCAAPAALAPNEGAAVVSTPIYQAMQDPTPAYGKQAH